MGKSKRLRILIKKARRGNRFAMYHVGIRYQLGKDLPLDMIKAAEWIFASAELGHAPAIEWINDYCFDDDSGVQANS